MTIAFPLLQSLMRLSPHHCYVVCTYISFILCMYIYICLYIAILVSTYIYDYSMYRVYVLEIIKMLSVAFKYSSFKTNYILTPITLLNI